MTDRPSNSPGSTIPIKIKARLMFRAESLRAKSNALAMPSYHRGTDRSSSRRYREFQSVQPDVMKPLPKPLAETPDEAQKRHQRSGRFRFSRDANHGGICIDELAISSGVWRAKIGTPKKGRPHNLGTDRTPEALFARRTGRELSRVMVVSLLPSLAPRRAVESPASPVRGFLSRAGLSL